MRRSSKKLQVQASISISVNQRYEDAGSAELIQAEIPQDGRALRVKLTDHLGQRE
jgi:hypothetical protein